MSNCCHDVEECEHQRELRLATNYKFTVEEVIHVVGRGWLHLGKIETEHEPAMGDACAFGPHVPNVVTVIGFERFAVPGWWRHGNAVGVLCRNSLPVGTVLRGNVKRGEQG